jgi:ABC-type lipoprotein export system ATPase subunit
MTARQNVLLPMRLSSVGRRERRRRAGFLLDTLGITHCADRTPDRMSGGEQQRAAIATALANQPKLLLADEPTGELDSSTARDVFSALRTANTELGVTMLVVTHDPAVSSQVRRTIAIRDGKTSSETYGTRPPMSGARPRCTHASTRRWTGRAGFSSRAR